MKYVSRVESTLKKGCAIDLAAKTLIVGPNGSGKSTVVQAIQLAACGYVSDVEERDTVSQHNVIARMFPLDGPWTAKITLTETDPQLVSAADTMAYEWELERGAGKAGGFKKPKPAAMALSFPVQSVLEKLRGSPDTIRAWLEGLVCPPLSQDALAATLPPAARDAGVAFAKRHRTTDLLYLAKAAQTEATELKKQADSKEATSSKMLEGVATPMLDDRRSELVADRDQLLLEVTAQSGRAPGTISQADFDNRMQAKVALEQQYQDLAEQVQRLASVVDDPNKQALLNKLEVLRDMYRVHAENFGLDACMMCGQGQGVHLTQNLARYLDALDKVKVELADATRRNQLLEAAKRVVDQHTKLVTELSTLRVADPIGDSASEKQGRLLEIQRALAADDAARIAWRNREAVSFDIEQLRARSDELTRLVKVFKRLGQKHLEDAKGEFEDRVTSFLPDKVKCQVDLDAGRIGFVDGETLITTVSGAQGMQLLFAVASFVASLGSTPCVLVNPDRAWSSDTLEATMNALTESPCQVILTSTVEPEHPVDGWHVIRLSKG